MRGRKDICFYFHQRIDLSKVTLSYWSETGREQSSRSGPWGSLCTLLFSTAMQWQRATSHHMPATLHCKEEFHGLLIADWCYLACVISFFFLSLKIMKISLDLQASQGTVYWCLSAANTCMLMMFIFLVPWKRYCERAGWKTPLGIPLSNPTALSRMS